MKTIDPTPVTMPRFQMVLHIVGFQSAILRINSLRRVVRQMRYQGGPVMPNLSAFSAHQATQMNAHTRR